MNDSKSDKPTAIPKTILGLVRMVAGLVVWASALVFLYAGQTLLCQQISPSTEAGIVNPVTAVLLGLVLVHFAALGLLSKRWFGHHPSEQMVFGHRLEGLILATSAFALLWLAIPILMVPPCA